MQIETCKDCKFWEWDNEPSEIKYGICHRYPRPAEECTFTKENYWCGEFTTKSKLHSG